MRGLAGESAGNAAAERRHGGTRAANVERDHPRPRTPSVREINTAHDERRVGGTIRILIADGDEGFAAELATRLEAALEGVTTARVATASAVDEALARDAVGCLIASSTLPERSVAAFLDGIRERAPRLPVVLLVDEGRDVDDVVAGRALAAVYPKATVAARPAYLLPTLRRLREGPVAGTGRFAEADLTRLFTEHALPMLLIEPETGTIVAANDAAVGFYGYGRGELTAMTIQDINALDPEQVAEKRRAAASGSTTQFVFPHRLASGEIRTVEVDSTPVTYDGRTVLFSIVRDTTERVEAETELRVARDRYQQLAEQNIVGIYTIRDRTFTYVNPRLAEMFGTAPGEMVGSSVFEYVAEADHDLVDARLRERERGDVRSSHYTFAGRHPEHDRLVVEVHGSRVETDEGVAIVGTMLDVTERDAAERELRRFSQALEYAAAGIYITDVDGVIKYVNPKFEAITGYAEEEAVGNSPAILNSGRMSDEYYQRLYDTLTAGEVWEEAIINRRKSGELYHAYQTIAPYRDEAGNLAGYVAVQSDVTHTRIQRQVLQVFQRIFRHNLRNKLNVIRGNAEVLRSELAGTPLEAHLDDITAAAGDLQGLSEKASIVEKAVDEGEDVPEIDLVRVLERECETLREQYPNVEISLAAPDELNVEGDGVLAVAVDELLTNAVVHCDHDRPRIEVRLGADDETGMARLEIEDDGPGLDDVELTTLEVGEETPLVHASGIGLWLVEWIVTNVGGDVEFAHHDSRGLTVTLYLPVASEPAPA